MDFICYTDWGQLPESANTLFEQAATDCIFFSRPWFENLASTLDPDQTMVLACVLTDNKVLAILPLIKSAENIWQSLKHRYTTHFSLLLADPERDQDQQRILVCLAEGLGKLSLKGLLLEPVANDDSKIDGLQRAMESAGYQCEQLFRFYNWIYRVQGQSFTDYMADRPAWLRNTISRKKRKLEREHGYDVRLFIGNDVPRAMSDYYAVYSASWKANEQYVGFLDGIVAGFSRPGWSRLAVLYVKGQPVAAQLWFVHHGKASIFRLAYDEEWKQYSPGSILTGFMMKYVIDTDKVEEIDFLTGNESYKRHWMSERRQRFALSCVKPERPAGWYDQLVNSLMRILKRR